MPITVIIPAHNEAAVIERCLRALTEGAQAGELELIVVANGCRDDTAAVARKFAATSGAGASAGANVKVIETEVPSKSNALNLGDAAAGGFPRFYVDADVALSLDALRQVAAALLAEGSPTSEGNGGALAAAPRAELDLSASSWAVRAYYAIDTKLPWFREGIGNAGVYALSRAGRARFERFPDLTTDDGFVRLHFRPHERRTVETAVAVVTAPATLAGLVAIKARSDFGRREILRHYPQLLANAGAANKPVLLRMGLDPRQWPALAVYAYVKLAARVRSRLKYRLGKSGEVANRWERDDSRPRTASHTAPPPAPAAATTAARPNA